MRVANRAVGGNHEHPAELRTVPDDRSLVHRDAPQPQPREHGVLGPARHDPRGEQLAQRRHLRAGELVGATVAVHEQANLYALRPPEVGRMLWRPMPDRGQLDSRLLELLTGAVQLHRVLAAEHSPVVAQEHQRRRPLAPDVPETDVVSLIVLQHHVLELARVRRRIRLLLGVDGV